MSTRLYDESDGTAPRSLSFMMQSASAADSHEIIIIAGSTVNVFAALSCSSSRSLALVIVNVRFARKRWNGGRRLKGRVTRDGGANDADVVFHSALPMIMHIVMRQMECESHGFEKRILLDCCSCLDASLRWWDNVLTTGSRPKRRILKTPIRRLTFILARIHLSVSEVGCSKTSEYSVNDLSTQRCTRFHKAYSQEVVCLLDTS